MFAEEGARLVREVEAQEVLAMATYLGEHAALVQGDCARADKGLRRQGHREAMEPRAVEGGPSASSARCLELLTDRTGAMGFTLEAAQR